MPLKLFVGFHGGQDVVFAGHPDVESGQQEDADDQVGEQAADDDDGEGSLRVRTNRVAQRGGQQAQRTADRRFADDVPAVIPVKVDSYRSPVQLKPDSYRSPFCPKPVTRSCSVWG
jgi:hypothetical protein